VFGLNLYVVVEYQLMHYCPQLTLVGHVNIEFGVETAALYLVLQLYIGMI
jgi:hypothetical protein